LLCFIADVRELVYEVAQEMHFLNLEANLIVFVRIVLL
jgi:hypothetical protein